MNEVAITNCIGFVQNTWCVLGGSFVVTGDLRAGLDDSKAVKMSTASC